jgi:hypothetical protein
LCSDSEYIIVYLGGQLALEKTGGLKTRGILMLI